MQVQEHKQGIRVYIEDAVLFNKVNGETWEVLYDHWYKGFWVFNNFIRAMQSQGWIWATWVFKK